MVDVLTGTDTVKAGHAQMLKGGVIMDVGTAEQDRIAEEAGAVAVMALERVPADIRADGGVARMTDPSIICEIMDTVSIPVMAKVRIVHFVEAQILESLGVDYIDESEVLTPADEVHHDRHRDTGDTEAQRIMDGHGNRHVLVAVSAACHRIAGLAVRFEDAKLRRWRRVAHGDIDRRAARREVRIGHGRSDRVGAVR